MKPPGRSPGKARRKVDLSSRGAGSAVKSDNQDRQLLKEKIARLENENSELKSRLRDLRRAGAATVKVVKAPTQFLEVKEKEQVKLPPIVQPTTHKKCDAEIKSLKDKIEDLKEIHQIEIEQLRGQLQEKITKAMEHSADVNRLQNLCRQLEGELAACRAKGGQQSVPNNNDSQRIRELEQQIEDYQKLHTTLQSSLTEAERTAASCAHIAKVKDEHCQDLESQLESGKTRLKESTKRLFELSEQNQRERDAFERRIIEAKDKAKEFQDMLKILKAAWTKREKEWLEYDKERNEKWKAEAKEWMQNASSKLEELKAGSDLLQDLTSRYPSSSKK